MPNAASAGVSSGSMIRKKILHVAGAVDPGRLDQLAGSSVMKLCSRKIASGSAKIVCDEPDRPERARRRPAASTYDACSSGISVTWSGTICSAKIATNRKSRPGKSIQANA